MHSMRDQNRKYSNASRGPRNRGSDPSPKQMSNAKSTAIGAKRPGPGGKGTPRGMMAGVNVRGQSRQAGRRHPRRTDTVGLDDAKTARVASNQGGYVASAKHKEKAASYPIELPASIGGANYNYTNESNQITSNIFDYTYSGDARSSKTKMQRRNRLNDRF